MMTRCERSRVGDPGSRGEFSPDPVLKGSPNSLPLIKRARFGDYRLGDSGEQRIELSRRESNGRARFAWSMGLMAVRA